MSVVAVGRGMASGCIAAMAMSGMRSLTTGLNLLHETPPDAIFKQKLPFGRIPVERRQAAVEIAHWGFGATGGAAFGALPIGIRRKWWVGPAYGMAIWTGFEAGIAPVLGLRQAKQRRIMERIILAADHLLYGIVVARMRSHEQ
jgi:hypothetical protein